MNTSTISKWLMWEYSLRLGERTSPKWCFHLSQVVCKGPASGLEITFSSWILCVTCDFSVIISLNWLWGTPQKFNVWLFMIAILNWCIAMYFNKFLVIFFLINRLQNDGDHDEAYNGRLKGHFSLEVTRKYNVFAILQWNILCITILPKEFPPTDWWATIHFPQELQFTWRFQPYIPTYTSLLQRVFYSWRLARKNWFWYCPCWGYHWFPPHCSMHFCFITAWDRQLIRQGTQVLRTGSNNLICRLHISKVCIRTRHAH